jgi:endonuclease/exonuclease/phosphatase (EEP) superfamily protein YafD
MKLKSKTTFFWRLHQLFFCFTLLVYGLTYFAFTGYWVVGFLMMSLPVLLIIHLIFCAFWLFFKPRKVWLSALALLLSFPFWTRTWKFPANRAAETQGAKEITVLSFNLMTFDVYNHLDGIHPQNALNLIAWAKNTDADIKCFQEFYNLDSRPNFNTLQQFKKAGYNYYTVAHPAVFKHEKHAFGLAIMSKYPIVNRDEREFQDLNGMLYADIKIGKDTIRVINVHFRSLIVRFGRLKEAYQEKDYNQGKFETRKVFVKIKKGFIYHAEETKLLTEWIDQSPHPVLLCGDFNETPYGFAYGQVRQRLSNSFENAGNGFGFTYQNAPRFIRIDNQFYDKNGLEILDFQTRKDVKYSDHYPIIGRYKLL